MGRGWPSGERWTYREAREFCETNRDIEPESRWIVIVLTIAHLDHVPENCADENLAALCQRCHNWHDAKTRAIGIRARAHEKRGQAALAL